MLSKFENFLAERVLRWSVFQIDNSHYIAVWRHIELIILKISIITQILSITIKRTKNAP